MKIIIKSLQKKIPVYPKRIKKAILKTLSQEGIKKSGEITVCFVSDRKIKKINLKFLGKNSTTDVIAFNIAETQEEILADIVVSTDTAIRNAKIFKTSPFYEICLYVIHGVLHLLGYDDKNVRQRKIMQDKANRILAALNISAIGGLDCGRKQKT